jgi:hypothetical protein
MNVRDVNGVPYLVGATIRVQRKAQGKLLVQLWSDHELLMTIGEADVPVNGYIDVPCVAVACKPFIELRVSDASAIGDPFLPRLLDEAGRLK